MCFTYVIPDLHGRDDLLADALAAIDARAAGEAATIVVLGDYVDKGPQSRQVVERLMAGIAGGHTMIALKGNHDAMMVQALRDPAAMDDWLGKGGKAALESYAGYEHLLPVHAEWLDRRPLMHVDAFRIYVHAGIDPELPLDRQPESVLLWKRYPEGYAGGHDERHVVHGHDNKPEGPLLYAGRSNLDAAAWRTGRLVIGIFDNAKAGGPVDFIVIQAAPEN